MHSSVEVQSSDRGDRHRPADETEDAFFHRRAVLGPWVKVWRCLGPPGGRARTLPATGRLNPTARLGAQVCDRASFAFSSATFNRCGAFARSGVGPADENLRSRPAQSHGAERTASQRRQSSLCGHRSSGPPTGHCVRSLWVVRPVTLVPARSGGSATW
jgi:hypothetical protein